MEKQMLISSSWYPVTGHMGMVQSCTSGGLDWTLGNISLLRGWSNTGTGFLCDRLSVPCLSVFKIFVRIFMVSEI